MAGLCSSPAHAPNSPALNLKSKTLKLSHARRTHAHLLLLLLATATSITAATQHSPSAPSSPARSSSNASYDASNPDYYTIEVGTTVTGTAGGEVYVVCTDTWEPFVFYNSTTNTIKGYEWDLFLAVSQAMGLSHDIRIMGWNEMMNNLALDRSDPNHCDIAPASIAITPDLLPTTGPKKLQLSIPTYHSGFGIATAVTWTEYDMWSFGRVFTVQLWAVLLGTALVLALLTYAAEHDYAKRGLGKTKYPTAFRPGMYEAVYNCVGKLFNVVQDLKVTSLAGKLISVGWGFLVLVAGTTYTAGITATLTSLNFKTKISGVADLPHFRVVSYSPVDRVFLRYGFMPKGMPWITEADGDAMLNAVSSGAADALVIEYPWLQYVLASRCDLALVGKPFHYVDNGVGFNANIPKSFVDEYNFHLMTLQQDGTYEEYQRKYFRANECPSLVASQPVVTFMQLQGLWIILGSFVVLAIILLILPHISSRFDADIKRSSVLDIKRIGKSIARLAARRSGLDPGMPKGQKMQSNPSFVQDSTSDAAAKVAGSTSSLEEHSSCGSQLTASGPGEVQELPRAAVGSVAPKAQDEDWVVPFNSDAGAAAYSDAGLRVDTNAPGPAGLMVSAHAWGEPSAYSTEVLASPPMVPKPSTAFLQLQAAHPDS